MAGEKNGEYSRSRSPVCPLANGSIVRKHGDAEWTEVPTGLSGYTHTRLGLTGTVMYQPECSAPDAVVRAG